MKAASAPLIALLGSNNQFTITDLLTITLNGGTVLRWTNWDEQLTFGGHTWVRSPSGPLFNRTKTRTVIGVEVDEMDLELMATASQTIGGAALIPSVVTGVLDAASVEVLQAFLSDAKTVVGTLVAFSGRIAEIEVINGQANCKVHSDLELLNIQMPKNVYQGGCVHTLYDAGCTISKAAFQVSSAVAAGSTRSLINSALAQASGYFDLGTIVFSSGANNGVKRTVKSYTPGVMQLSYPLPTLPSNGDTFVAAPGCDKTQATCTTKFSNLPNFRGFPYIPIPEVLLGT